MDKTFLGLEAGIGGVTQTDTVKKRKVQQKTIYLNNNPYVWLTLALLPHCYNVIKIYNDVC